MKTQEFNFFDAARNRSIPAIIYLPDNKTDNTQAGRSLQLRPHVHVFCKIELNMRTGLQIPSCGWHE
jgi:hypothetical protein